MIPHAMAVRISLAKSGLSGRIQTAGLTSRPLSGVEPRSVVLNLGHGRLVRIYLTTQADSGVIKRKETTGGAEIPTGETTQ